MSVRRSVGPSVRRSIGPSVRNAFVSAVRDEPANDLFRVYELVIKALLFHLSYTIRDDINSNTGNVHEKKTNLEGNIMSLMKGIWDKV